jgi:uncharacterized protein DUF6064
MTQWWTYSPADFLLFSPRVYYRLLELHNETMWPAQVLTLGLGLMVLLLILRSTPSASRWTAAILGALWIWVSWSFLWERYATINWAMTYVAPVFAAQGLFLIWFGAIRARLELAQARNFAWWGAIALLAVTVTLYPILAPLMGRPWRAAEIFGIVADPTAVATLAFLALVGRGSWLMIIPAVWCLLSSETLWLLQADDFFIPVVGAATALVLRWTQSNRQASA